MIGENRAFFLEKMQQVGHLLEIGGHIGIVAAQMNVVELDINDVLDALAARSELAARGVRRRDAGSQEHQQRACRVMSNPIHLSSPMFCWIVAAGEVIRAARERDGP